jgi:hypothetical protein
MHWHDRRQEGSAKVRALMEVIFVGPREFVDLTILEEWTP